MSLSRILATMMFVFCVVGALTMPVQESTTAAFSADTGATVSFRHRTPWPQVVESASWWLDSAETSTLFSNTACTTATPQVIGGAVRCWADRQVAGQALTLGTGAAVPELAPTTIAATRPVRFDDDTLLTGPDVLNGPIAGFTMAIVLREQVQVKNTIVSLNGGSTSNRVSLHAPWDDSIWYFDAGDTSTNRVRTAPSATNVGDTTLFLGWKDPVAGSNSFRLNGGTTHSSSGYTAAVTTGGLYLGEVPFLDTVPDHEVAELIIIDHAVTAVERDRIEEYLTDKWNL